MDSDGVDGYSTCFVHHGNKGAGEAVKPKLRAWLKRHGLVSRVGAAELSEGGDAYTVVELVEGGDD